MTGCKHTQWLRVSRNQGFALEVSDRTRRLLDGLARPDKQSPSMIVLLGNKSKGQMLNKLGVTTTRPRGKRGHGEVHMFVSPSSARTNHPILVADGDIPRQNRLGGPSKPQLCHEVTVRPLVNTGHGKVAEIADHIYHRVVLPFADLVCFFASDLGGIEQVVHHVALWMDKGQPTTTELRPWLMIVVDDGVEDEMLTVFEDLMRAETSIDINDRFGGIRLTSLNQTRQRPRASGANPWNRLHREMADICYLKRQNRLALSYAFTARHLAGFLEYAASHATEALQQPFNFIHIARLQNPIAENLESHLVRFLNHIQSLELLKGFALPMIASSFILDHYVPGMHTFHPRDVFNSLYKQTCSSVCKGLNLFQSGTHTWILPSAFVKLLEEELSTQFAQYLIRGSAKSLHRQVMGDLQRHWVNIRSDDTCFCCIRRRPQFGLSCGHSICQICLKVFGRVDLNDQWVFHIDACFLCNKEIKDTRIKVKPDTASVRVLSIDGGGTRGRAPLEFVRVLQDRLRLPYPVQNHFDIVYGTSSGAIIASALFINGWSVDDCIASFESLARLAFKPRPLCWIPMLSKVYELALSLLVDSRYPARNLETALQLVFGATSSIIDCSKASEVGAMVGMPVTTIQDVSTYVFTSYNGVGTRDGCSDYNVLKPEASSHRIPLWEVLRCATAAPYYFKPHHIDRLGTFQDGGLMYNNPASIALQEVAALFPATPEPSLVVSLGTGSARARPQDTSKYRSSWKDSFLSRIFRAFWQYGNSKRAWQQLLSHQKVGKAGEFFRFDVEFEGPEPSLDNVDVMKEIGNIARETILDSTALDRLISCIRAELFIFELDPHQPFYLINGMYECTGRIYCRLRAKTPEFHALMEQLDQTSASFLLGDNVVQGSFQDRSAKLQDGNFSKEVRLRTASRLEPFTISLRENDNTCPISGAPFTLQSLIDAQNLDARFGTADHRKRKWPTEGVEEPQQKRLRNR